VVKERSEPQEAMGLLARVGSVPGILFSFAVSFIVYLCSLPSLPATVAILVAAPINYAVSQAIFTHWIVEKIDEVFYQTIRENNLEKFELVRDDYHRLLKMKGFFPPHDNPIVTLGFSFGAYLLLTKVMVIGVDYLTKPMNRDNSLFLSQSPFVRILNSTIAGIFIFSALFSSYRIGEMHFIIITLNLAHMIVVFTCSNFVFATVLRLFAQNAKEKNN
ncbi:hypothetical protein PRIPAC_93556, partial [Pristionchus pacificus]|uniref:Uncharacterized protein n=1 Tax=Pristionchus pacificus TaxID=54126 RepID=A0A8R1V5K7_PRIPA